MILAEALRARKAVVDKALADALDACFPGNSQSGGLSRAMHYSLFAGGKRFRPILLLFSSELCGGTVEHAMYAAVAMEFIHTYSLIHDDLPAMDDAEIRRGQATVHRKFGEGLAVLAGDGLLTEAFSILAQGPPVRVLECERYFDVVKLIADASGVRGMVRGQELDLLYEGKNVDSATLKIIHEHKTAAMFRASLAAGAVLGGGSREKVDRLTDYGTLIGLAFQIRDDMLDVEGDPDLVGKDLGADRKKGKSTYPALYGAERAGKEMDSLIRDAVDLLSPFGEKAWFFAEIANLIGTRSK